MAVKKVDETSLTTVADSIRAKAGITDQLVFPSGFVSAVQAIQAGGEDYLAKLIMDTLVEYSSSEVTRVARYTFAYKNSLKKLSLPNAKALDENCFFICPYLEEIIIPKVTVIGEGAFYGCSRLKLSELPKELTALGYRAFNRCSSIEIKEIPEGLKVIDSITFEYCTKITSLTFKGKMNSIDSTAFKGCTDLLTINVPWAEGEVSGAPWGATNATINYDYVESE